MDLINNLKNREPYFDSKFEDMILRFTIEQGGERGTRSEEDRYELGRIFSTKYEIFMYAAIIGLKNDYPLPIPKENNKKKFRVISAWRPVDIVDFIIMSVIAKSGINFNDLEYKEDEEVRNTIDSLRELLEKYANGGFDMINSFYNDKPEFFEHNENCFLDLLDELAPQTENSV